jgi:hypothetical protein
VFDSIFVLAASTFSFFSLAASGGKREERKKSRGHPLNPA